MCLLLALAFISAAVFAPSAAGAEDPVSADAVLDAGPTVNAKMKSVAVGRNVQYWTQTEHIKAVRMADKLPDSFVPSETNTVSAADSGVPIYIFFDNENDAGIMYFYTEGSKVILNPDSSMLFAYNTALADISGVADWDASRIVYMYGMLLCARSLPDALALRNWDTSGVTDMRFLFNRATSLLFIDVSGWNTSKVLSMESTFAVGDSWMANGQLQEIIGLENLDVSNVRDMTCMFYGAGRMTHYNIGGWDVSKVESMNHMFCDNRELRYLDLSGWDVSSVRTVYCMFDDNVSLTTIGDVSRWNTASLIDAGGWLNGCRSFVGDDSGTLDLSGWDTRNLRCTGEMFFNTRMRTVDLSGWTFDSITNDRWEEAGSGYYYETGNDSEKYQGLGGMFKDANQLRWACLSQEGLDSYNAAVERGVNTLHMWHNTQTQGFMIK